MSTKLEPLVLLGAGVITAVGDDLDSTCAAMRVRFNNHQEINYVSCDGEPVVASLAAIHPALTGESRLVEMAVHAIREATSSLDTKSLSLAKIPWLLCTPEESRYGRPDSDAELLQRIAQQLGVSALHPLSTTIPKGRSAGLIALQQAQAIFADGKENLVLVVAADSLVSDEALADFDDEGVLLTSENSSGFIPGEAAAALLFGRAGKATLTHLDSSVPILVVESIATTTNDPEELRKAAELQRKPPIDGRKLAAAISTACRDAGCQPETINVRFADCNGTESGFKESALAEVHVFTAEDADLPELWLPAESLGEIGAAYAPAAIAWVSHAARKAYLPNHLPGHRVLIHATNLDGQHSAAILNCLEI